MQNTPKARELLALSRNFMECRVLLTGAELNIFKLLAEPASSRDIARNQGWYERPLTVLLDALTAMGLLIKSGSRYRTDPDLLPYLHPDAPQTVLPMIRHAATIWKNWFNLTQIVTQTGGVQRPPASFEDPEDRKAFIGAMHVVGRKIAPKIVEAIHPPDAAKRLLDVGGGSGTYLDTNMVRRSKTTPLGRPESGAEAEVFLAVSSAMEGVTGKYFNVKTEARADPQAYDQLARKQLRELSLGLTA